MPANLRPSFDVLLQRARAGEADALGHLLESYHSYLNLIARSLLRAASCASVDVSDVVQETNFKACRGITRFEGHDEPQFAAWLRQILVNHVLNLRRKREGLIHHPESLEAMLDRASTKAHIALAAPGSTPSAHASRREQAVLTANALDSLRPHYRQILIFRCLDCLSHAEISRRMGCSEGAARMLWVRAAEALHKKLLEQP